MAKLKIGEEIKTYEDVRNLVTGIIFRLEKFKKQNILDLVKIYTAGSKLEINERKLNTLIEESLDLFQNENLISCENGVYTATNINNVIADYLLKKDEQNIISF